MEFQPIHPLPSAAGHSQGSYLGRRSCLNDFPWLFSRTVLRSEEAACSEWYLNNEMMNTQWLLPPFPQSALDTWPSGAPALEDSGVWGQGVWKGSSSSQCCLGMCC